MARAAKKMDAPQHSPDDIRGQLLRFLYDHHRKAKGVTAQEIGIRDLQQALKARFGLSQSDVAHNLDYLLQQGWVIEVRKNRTFKTPRGMELPREQITYKISKAGMEQIEGDSEFRRTSPYGGINISSLNNSVVVVGHRNVVKTRFAPLAEALEELRRELPRTDLPEEVKKDATADLETIQQQLAKEQPDTSIVARAWGGVEKVVTVGTLADLGAKVGHLIATTLMFKGAS